MRIGHIYCYTNNTNGKKYVGQTKKTVHKRAWRHRDDALNQGSDCAFHRAIRKYGYEAFTLETLASVPVEFLDHIERTYILLLNSHVDRHGYNCTFGGETGVSSEESRAKISAALKGRPKPPGMGAKVAAYWTGRKRGPNSPEVIEAHRQYMLSDKNPNRGVKRTPEERKKISEACKGRPAHNKGKPLSEETKRRVSEANKGRSAPNKGVPMSEEQKRKLSEHKKNTPLSAAHKASYEARKGKPLKSRGRKQSEEAKAKMKAGWARRKTALEAAKLALLQQEVA